MKNDVSHKFDIEFARVRLQEIESSDLGEVYYTDDVRKCYHLLTCYIRYGGLE